MSSPLSRWRVSCDVKRSQSACIKGPSGTSNSWSGACCLSKVVLGVGAGLCSLFCRSSSVVLSASTRSSSNEAAVSAASRSCSTPSSPDWKFRPRCWRPLTPPCGVHISLPSFPLVRGAAYIAAPSLESTPSWWRCTASNWPSSALNSGISPPHSSRGMSIT